MTVRSRICLQHIPTYLSSPDDGRVIGDFATAGCTLSSSELTNGPHQSSAKRYQEPGSDVPGPKVPFFALNIIYPAPCDTPRLCNGIQYSAAGKVSLLS